MNTKLMDIEQPCRLRKHLIVNSTVSNPGDGAPRNELDLQACAVVHFSSEHPDHPIDHLFDADAGPGASKWLSARRNTPETILLVFDEPMNISRCAFEAEDRDFERTQEVCAEYLAGDATSYRRAFIQEFNFSPSGAIYQNESIAMTLSDVRRLRLTIRPHKSGHGFATLTSLRLYR